MANYPSPKMTQRGIPLMRFPPSLGLWGGGFAAKVTQWQRLLCKGLQQNLTIGCNWFRALSLFWKCGKPWPTACRPPDTSRATKLTVPVPRNWGNKSSPKVSREDCYTFIFIYLKNTYFYFMCIGVFQLFSRRLEVTESCELPFGC